jgi:predicted Zn-dependent protease
MRKYLKYSILLAFALVSTHSFGQKCGHDLLEEEIKRQNPNFESDWAEFISTVDFDSDQKTEGTVFTIPVVVHIIYDDASDNITDKQVKNAIEVLNEDYRRLNPDTSDTRGTFLNVAADCEIEFKLAKLDPNGNCHTGITRTQSALSVNANNNVKSLKSWPRTKYVNIWVVNSIDLGSSGQGTVLGYAYKPSPGQSTTYDGIVIRHDRMGRIGTSSSRGRTLTHEMGHYLGLDHPFKGGCFQGDNCADTPPVDEASFGCNLTANTCSNDNPNLPDQIENYMDYADDDCVNMFTDDQKAIMRSSLNSASLRGYLITATNATATGIDPQAVLPCAPQANFGASQTVFCKGTTVQFTDKSEFGNPTSWSWYFQGGTPTTSNAQNPTVTYNSAAGVGFQNYTVSLTVTNATGSSQSLTDGFISVRRTGGGTHMWVNNFSSGFEFHDIPNGTWHVENADGDDIKWERNSYNHYDGNYCVKLDNFNNDPDNSDALITDQIVVNRATAMSLGFRYAVASKPGQAQDKLRISVSQDCGETWEEVRTILGPLLYAALNKANPWNPTSASNWRSASINLNDYAGGAPIMIKVDFISGGGNNAFLDAFNLDVTLDQEELSANSINIFPNPSNGLFQVEGLPAGTAYRIFSIDGREIQQGTLALDASLQVNASPGYYIFQTEGVRKQLIIQ